MSKSDFIEIYNQYKGLVWRLVSKYVAGQQDREDIFQEVFLKVHKALPKFRGQSSLETWIFRIAVNTAIDHIKKQKRYKLLTDFLAHLRVEEGIVTEEVEATNVLLKPLEKLNPQQRTIMILADIEERKLEEIGQMLDLPVGTVKSNLFRAREIIRKELRNNG
jgi:RNA polymerase sigma-70 factor (ECF subfamily)